MSSGRSFLSDRVTGWVCFALGVLFCSDWLIGRTVFVQITRQHSVIPFHSSLAFLVLGLVYVLSPGLERTERSRRLAMALATFPLALGLVSVVQAFLGIETQIEELLLRRPVLSRLGTPIVLSPVSGICFVALAAARIVKDAVRPTKMRDILLLAANILVFTFAIISLFGYFSKLPAGYNWGNVAPMPLQSAIIFAALGMQGIVNLAFWRAPEVGTRYVAGSLACIVLGTTLGVANAIRMEERLRLENFAAVTAEAAVDEVAAVLDYHLEGFLSMVALLDRNGAPDERERDFEFIVSRTPAILGIVALDSEWQRIWAHTQDAALAPTLEERLLADFPGESAPEFPDFAVREIEPGGAIYFVTRSRGMTLAEAFDTQRLFQYTIRSFEREGQGLTITWGSQVSPDSEPALGGRFRFGGLVWSVDGTITPYAQNNKQSSLSVLLMLLGTIVAMLAYYLPNLILRLREREKALNAEVERRRGVEEMLRKAKARADDASRSKSAFLASMSHELRTPLNALMGFAEILELDPESPERGAMVHGIMRNSEMLGSLIDDILDLSKIEAGRLSIEEVATSLSELARDVITMLGHRAKAKGLSLDLVIEGRIPETICTDPTRVRQILLNLVSNAIKFTESGRVTVRFGVDERDQMLRIDVEDTGIGVSPAQMARLFQPFSQADSDTTRRYGGSGLGLVLSLRLAEALGGEVRLVRSAPGQGSLFRARIALAPAPKTQWIAEFPPLETDAAVDAGDGVGKLPRFEGRRVLVVDDAPDNRAVVGRYLGFHGIDCDMASNGSEALDRSAGEDYALILLDIQMPVLNGYEAARELRRRSYRGRLVALTANAMKEERARCLAAGFDDYIAKPIRIVDLTRILTETFGEGDAPRRVGAVRAAEPELDPLKQILPLFLEKTSERTREIQVAAAEGNSATLLAKAHQIKGSAGAFGYPELMRAAAAIEDAVREGLGPAAIAERVARLISLAAAIKERAQDGAQGPGAGDDGDMTASPP